MFKALLKARFQALFSSFTKGKKDEKKAGRGTAILLIIVFAFLALYFAFTFFIMFSALSVSAKETGDSAELFALATLVSSGLCLFGSIFTTKNQIFESKDNELLLSMPIPVSYIFLSRMVVLLVVNYVLEALVMLPCFIAYQLFCGFTPLSFIFAALVFLINPLLMLAISTLIAWLITEISSRMKNKTIVSTVLYVLFFVGYMLITMTSSESETIDLSWLGNSFVFWWAGDAIGNQNALSLLLYLLCAIVPSLITFFILKSSFTRILTTKRSSTKTKYKGNKAGVSSPLFSLYKKELSRLFSSSTYLLNSSMGSLMSIVIAIVMLVENPIEALAQAGEGAELIKSFVPIIVAGMGAVFGSFNMVSAPSISLEDKSLWILQVSPVSSRDVLMAKLLCHITVSAPFALISTTLMCIAFNLELGLSIMAVALAILSTVMTGYLGLFLGLKFPKFDWENEQVAVKSGFAVFGAMFLPMLLNIVLIGVGILLSFLPYLAIGVMLIPSIVISIVLHIYLVKRGTKVFENLKH